MIFGEESPHTKKIKVTQNIFIRDAMMVDRTDHGHIETYIPRLVSCYSDLLSAFY